VVNKFRGQNNMIHQFIFAAPKPGMSVAEFQDYWLNFHAVKYASKISQIKKYLIDLTIDTKFDVGEPLYNGIAEIWLNNDEEQIASLQSEEFLQGARLDEPNWAAFWKTLVLDTDLVYENNTDYTGKGVKMIVIAKRKNGVELQDFRNFASNNHITKLENIAGVKKVRLNFVRDGWYFLGEPRFDMVSSIWFENLNSMYITLSKDDDGICMFSDINFVNSNYVFCFYVNENWVIGPEARD
jgi:hypothetical protein